MGAMLWITIGERKAIAPMLFTSMAFHKHGALLRDPAAWIPGIRRNDEPTLAWTFPGRQCPRRVDARVGSAR